VLSVVVAQVAVPRVRRRRAGGIACELVQTGSLYHDDVMDEAPTRPRRRDRQREVGQPSGDPRRRLPAVAASEIAAVARHGDGGSASRARSVVSAKVRSKELRHTYNPARPESSYLASIAGKTASLYSTSARIGGIVGGLDRSLVDAVTVYGHAFGMVFQIVDDVLDITSTDDQLGKPAGHDMVEGVYTLPVLRTLQRGGIAAASLLDVLGRPLEPSEREKALEIVRANGGVASAVATAREWAEAAIEACVTLPASPATDALRDAPHALLASLPEPRSEL
jgi:geranylgeranyl pyrophosphate synthase